FQPSASAPAAVDVSSSAEEEDAKRKAEEEAKRKAETEAKRKAEEEARKRKAEEEAPVFGARAAITASGAVLIRKGGKFVPLTGPTIPIGTEIDATGGRVVVTVATKTGGTATAEVYGGRFKLTQDTAGVTHFVLTLPLTGCPRVQLPKGAAARRKG